MYLKQVTIENFRGIAKMTLNLQPGVNLLIGNNGVGKTSILEAIVVGLGACFKDIPVANAISIKPEDIRQELHVVDGSPSVKYRTPVRVSCTADICGETYTWARTRKDEAPKKQTTIECTDKEPQISDWFRNASNETDTSLPVLNYQSINRVSNSKRSDFGSSSKQLNDRRCGYTGCLDSALDDKFIRKWCYAMMRKSGKSLRYNLFRDAVSNVMRHMNTEETAPCIDFSEEFGEDGDFVFEDGNSVMPIAFLSAGYQSCLWMVMDIAFRALLLNPGTTSMEEISGVVLIDEVDKHLHPKWQWNVLNALHDTFPNIQFIITTHAPIVISSYKYANIQTIDSTHTVKPTANTYGYGIEDVIQYTQESDAVVPKLRELYEQFENAFVQKDLELAKKYADEIDNEFPQSTECKKARTKLRYLNIGG